MNFDIVAERFKRVDKITIIMALLMLFGIHYIVQRVTPLLVYYIDMLGIGNNSIYRFSMIVKDYLVVPIILIYYTVEIVIGAWDLRYTLILRHKENISKYILLADDIVRSTDEIKIHRNKEIKTVSVKELEQEFSSNPKGAYLEIDGAFSVLKDLKVSESCKLEKDSILVRRETYQYTGKKLLYNKNIVSHVYYLETCKIGG